MKKYLIPLLLFLCLSGQVVPMVYADEEAPVSIDDVVNQHTIFDDKMLLNGYAAKYQEESLSVLMAMIQDEGLMSYKVASAIKVLREEYGDQLVGRDLKIAIQHLWRRLHRSDSAFVQVEAMLALLKLDRYRYFGSLMPALIQKIDHYNRTVNEMAFKGAKEVLDENGTRAREARIVFNLLRKMMFLSRNRLKTIDEPSQRLQYKLTLLRWSIKVLGTEELKRLPDEVIGLL